MLSATRPNQVRCGYCSACLPEFSKARNTIYKHAYTSTQGEEKLKLNGVTGYV
jgi:hypothetical protein